MPACRKLYLTLFAAGSLLQAGCQTLPATTDNQQPDFQPATAVSLTPTINPSLYIQGAPAPQEQIFDLTEAQREQFLHAYHHELTHLRPHLRVANYLERLTASYNYRERTLIAAEAFAGTPGNCMSLVVLTTALANLVDLDIDYQRLTANPIFDKQQGLILVSDHVRTRVFAPATENFVLQRAHAVIDYFPARGSRNAERIPLETLLAMYYSNLSAESILDGELTAATQFAMFALDYAPTHPSAHNLLAILHRRIGDDDSAEAFFRFALQEHPEELNLLNNYRLLLTEQSREQEAAEINQRIAELNDINPFQLIALADLTFERGEYSTSLDYYQQAAEVAPYLHEVYLRQAKVLKHMGKDRQAMAKLEEGFAQAERSATEAHFKRQLSAFKASSQQW